MANASGNELAGLCRQQISNFLSLLRLLEKDGRVDWSGSTVKDVTQRVEEHYTRLVSTILSRMEQWGTSRGGYLQRPPIVETYAFSEGLPKGLGDDPEFVDLMKAMASWLLRFDDVMVDWKAYPRNLVQAVKCPEATLLGSLGDPEFWEVVSQEVEENGGDSESVENLKRWVKAGLGFMLLRPHLQTYVIPLEVNSTTFRQEFFHFCQSLGVHCDFRGTDWVVLSRHPVGGLMEERGWELMSQEVSEMASMQLALQSKEELISKIKGEAPGCN